MEPVKLEGNEIDEVETFTYLGSITDKHGGADADVKAKIGKARGAFIQLKRRILQIRLPNTINNSDVWEKNTNRMLEMRSEGDDGGGLVTHSGNQYLVPPDRP